MKYSIRNVRDGSTVKQSDTKADFVVPMMRYAMITDRQERMAGRPGAGPIDRFRVFDNTTGKEIEWIYGSPVELFPSEE